jgi:hypothetical protein
MYTLKSRSTILPIRWYVPLLQFDVVIEAHLGPLLGGALIALRGQRFQRRPIELLKARAARAHLERELTIVVWLELGGAASAALNSARLKHMQRRSGAKILRSMPCTGTSTFAVSRGFRTPLFRLSGTIAAATPSKCFSAGRVRRANR